MKLPPRSDIVKPDATVLAVAAATVLVTALVLWLLLSLTSREEQRMEAFGGAAARALAELAAQPVMRQDRMHLGVITNRLAELPEIRGVASYSADNKLLTTTGNVQAPHHTQPVIADDSIVGYVRVALEPEAFAVSHPGRTIALLTVLLLIPFAVAVTWSVIRAAREGRITPWLPQRRDRSTTEPGRPSATEDADAPPDPPDPPPLIRHYLLAVNLYNQLTLPPSEREFELSLCTELAEAVAEIYQGQVVSLPGVGILVDFDHTGDEDRAFQVLCGAFLLARLLRDEAPFGTYRLGINLIENPADEALPLNHEAVADAALLSALAKNLFLAVSGPCFDALQGRERLQARPLHNPLLDQLSTSDTGCYLVTELDPSCAGLVLQQAEQLRSQRDAISNPSTF